MRGDRMARVNRLIQTTLADLLPLVRDPRVREREVLAVTGVRTSPDLHYARVYLSIAGSEEEQRAALSGLAHARGFLRAELGERVRLRFLPELSFELDESIASGARVEGILRELAAERQPQRRAEQTADDAGDGEGEAKP
jgi:ribosome-binding factor A